MKEELHKVAQGKLFEFAKANRKKHTDAEYLIWQELRGRKLKGAKFRRQHPFGTSIADFYCHEAGLVVELDGAKHTETEQQEYDAGRTFELAEVGLTVIRIRNEEVFYEMGKVLELIARHLNPGPSPQGEGS